MPPAKLEQEGEGEIWWHEAELAAGESAAVSWRAVEENKADFFWAYAYA
jgi:hypothetical protein